MSHNLCLKGYGQCPWQTPTSVTQQLLKNVPSGSIHQQALYVLGQYHAWCFNQIAVTTMSKEEYSFQLDQLHDMISSMKDHINNGKWNALPFYSN